MPRPKISDERREEILKAFEACVVRKGLTETTLEDVAVESGLPRSLVRYFIGNRDNMVNCLIERILNRGEKRAISFLNKISNPTPEQITDLMFDELLGDNTTSIIIMELWHLALRDDKLRIKLASVYHRLIDEVVNNIKDDSTNKETKKIFDVAFTATALAFGTALFNYMGLTGYDSSFIRSHVTKIITDIHDKKSKIKRRK